MTDQPVPQQNTSQDKNASQEHARHELHNQAGKSLFFINGAGAVALLTFL